MTSCATGNNKKTEGAESAAAIVGTCDITNPTELTVKCECNSRK
jgi:hypothetical protein